MVVDLCLVANGIVLSNEMVASAIFIITELTQFSAWPKSLRIQKKARTQQVNRQSGMTRLGMELRTSAPQHGNTPRFIAQRARYSARRLWQFSRIVFEDLILGRERWGASFKEPLQLLSI